MTKTNIYISPLYHEARFMKHEVHQMIGTVSKGSQVTIPAQFKEKFGLQPGTRFNFVPSKKGLLLSPLKDELEQLFEEAKELKPRRNMTAKQMDEEIEDAICR